MQQPTVLVEAKIMKQSNEITDFDALKEGDWLNWRQQSRGGYHYVHSVAALFKKSGPKRIQIEVMQKGLYDKQWTRVLKWVERESLTHRLLPSEAFYEPMELDVKGFKLTVWRHPVGNTQVFKNGVFYGEIDGLSVTAPVGNKEDALYHALHALQSGGYRTALLTALECYQGWLKQDLGEVKNQQAREEIANTEKRLEKLDAWEVSLPLQRD
jgi:hypothetical protein